MSKPDEKAAKRGEFAASLQEMSDDALVGTTEHYVWLSGYAANNPRSDYHWMCDATYDEAVRRGKRWLYQRGWNQAYEVAGHEPSASDLAAAREPQP